MPQLRNFRRCVKIILGNANTVRTRKQKTDFEDQPAVFLISFFSFHLFRGGGDLKRKKFR